MSFGAKLRIKTDGDLSADHSTITVIDATYVIVYSAFETNYDVGKFDIDETIDFKSKLNETIDRLINEDYENIFKMYNVKKCFYGHLHSKASKNSFEGICNGIEYKLVSSDYMEFMPYKIT